MTSGTCKNRVSETFKATFLEVFSKLKSLFWANVYCKLSTFNNESNECLFLRIGSQMTENFQKYEKKTFTDYVPYA